MKPKRKTRRIFYTYIACVVTAGLMIVVLTFIQATNYQSTNIQAATIIRQTNEAVQTALTATAVGK